MPLPYVPARAFARAVVPAPACPCPICPCPCPCLRRALAAALPWPCLRPYPCDFGHASAFAFAVEFTHAAACEARELQRPPERAAMAERDRHSNRAAAIVNDEATLAEIAFISVVPLFAGAVDTAFAVASVARVGGSLGMI